MPQFTPMPTLVVGDILTTTRWGYLRDNLNKLLNTGHRVLTVAQFNALTGLEGTKGTVAPDEVYLEVDSANGIQWHLAYESGETTYKWRFIGGPPMYSEVATAEATTSSTYVALTTAGPSIAIPRAGDFDVLHGGNLITAGSSNTAFMSYDIGGTGAVDADDVELSVTAAPSVSGSLSRQRRKTGLTAITLTAKYKSSGAVTATFKNRFMAVTPVRLV